MRSRTGADFRVLISTPMQPPPHAGYPVIYMLDANAMFGTITDALALQSARPEATGVMPAVVVGIGYATEQPLAVERRTYDYTPPVAPEKLSPRPDGSAWPQVGGADALHAFIVDELKPLIGAEFPIDPRHQVLFGHSFGGLFVLYTLFNHPGSYKFYVAGSPSIWFGGGAILDVEKQFAERVAGTNIDSHLMLGVGALEQTPGPNETAASPRGKWLAQNRMVDNAREISARLGALEPNGLRLRYEEFPGENHVSVVPALVSRALRFALAPH